MAKKRAFKVKDIFRYKVLGGVTVTADGSMAAFVATQPSLDDNEIVSEIWLWSERCGVRQVTFGGKAGQPSFSPKRDRLAFVSNRSGGKGQIYVMDGPFSEGRKVTDFAHGVVKFAWSPDGKKLAIVAKPDKTDDEKQREKDKRDWWTVDVDERRRALWVVSADGRGKPVQLSKGGEHVSSVAWTPDGDRLVYTACPGGTINSQWFESDVKTVTVKGKGRRTICPVRGHLVDSPIHVSPDGKRLLVSEAYDDKDLFHDTAKVIDLKTGEKKRVHPRTDLRSVAPQWLDDDRVFFEAQVGASFELHVCTVGGKPERLPTGPCVAANAAIARKAGRVFFLYSEPDVADELYSVSLTAADEQAQLSRVNRAMDTLQASTTEVVQWESEGGMAVEGLLHLPTKSGARKPYPLIVMPHGGPYSGSVTSFGRALVPNIFCAAGYACFQPNFRGSTGYGRAFTRKIVRDWGDGPFADIMAGVDALIERGVVDAERMAIFGGSYGGYMTAWAVGHTDRFRCAVAVAAVTDNLSMWGTTDIPDFQIYSSAHVPASFTDAYWRDQSPLYYVDNVKTPTLVITGEVDVRVPPGQSHEFYRGLKARGVPTQLVLYPREPHGVSEPRHRLHYFQQILDYINEHVMG